MHWDERSDYCWTPNVAHELRSANGHTRRHRATFWNDSIWCDSGNWVPPVQVIGHSRENLPSHCNHGLCAFLCVRVSLATWASCSPVRVVLACVYVCLFIHARVPYACITHHGGSGGCGSCGGRLLSFTSLRLARIVGSTETNINVISHLMCMHAQKSDTQTHQNETQQ